MERARVRDLFPGVPAAGLRVGQFVQPDIQRALVGQLVLSDWTKTVQSNRRSPRTDSAVCRPCGVRRAACGVRRAESGVRGQTPRLSSTPGSGRGSTELDEVRPPDGRLLLRARSKFASFNGLRIEHT
jgi:hypothetical protein